LIPLPIFLFILLELVFVAWADIRTNKIINLWSILNLIVFFILLFVAPEYYFLRLETFLYSSVFLLVGFVLFLLKIMGGGDSKFLFTFFLIVPLNLHVKLFNYLLVSTVLVGTFVLITNIAKNFDKILMSLRIKDIDGFKSCFGSKFAFAPVILIAWIWLGWTIKNKILY
jgi:prepilin peptidase CpaA